MFSANTETNHNRWIGNGEQRFEGVYKVQREGEEARFLKSGIGNRRFLWHGTSITNLVSILNRGLIVTPLDVSRTGERFGKVGSVYEFLSSSFLGFCLPFSVLCPASTL